MASRVLPPSTSWTNDSTVVEEGMSDRRSFVCGRASDDNRNVAPFWDALSMRTGISLQSASKCAGLEAVASMRGLHSICLYKYDRHTSTLRSPPTGAPSTTLMNQQPDFVAAVRQDLSDWRQWLGGGVVLAYAGAAGLAVVAFTWLSERALHGFMELRAWQPWLPLAWTPA